MPDLTYRPTTSRELGAYLAVPRGDGPWPGVVVIMDLLGLNDDLRVQCDRLAAEGYLAFAPDLYSGRGLKCVVATMKAARSGKGEAYENIEAARRWLAERDDCTGHVGVIGFCLGGGFALLCAPRYEFRVASVNYGEVPEDGTSKLAGACPIVASYGARDRRLQGHADRLRSVLSALGVEHDVKEYADSGHAFMNRMNAGPVLTALTRIAGVDYRHDSAEDSWRRILDFFDHHLRTAPDGSTEQAS